MKAPYYLIHYGEIALKKGNRRRFIDMLIKNLKDAFLPEKISIQRMHGRFLVESADMDASFIEDGLSRIFGIVNFSPAWKCTLTVADLEKTVLKAIKGREFKSFGVFTKRPNKSFELSSIEIGVRIGALVQKETGSKVNLKNPEFPIFVEVVDDCIIVAADKMQGPGGLPVGSAGKVVCMLSGGIDSPVAVWRMMKRGCSPIFVHFHSAPFTSLSSVDKTMEIAEEISKFQPAMQIITIPIGEVQQKIVSACSPEFRIVLYRRFMLRLAERIAYKSRAHAIVTGEALSQVSSQTLRNLVAIERAVDVPIFRPLIGMDKHEIIAEARAINTFDLSIKPHDDCCSFLTPDRPTTRATSRELEVEEAKLDVGELVEKAWSEREKHTVK